MKDSTEHVWYHCGRCGSLFGADFGHDESRVCAECLKQPGTGVWPAGEKPPGDAAPAAKEFSKQPEMLVEDGDGRRAVRKKRKRNVMMRVIVVWTFLLLLAVWLRHHYSKDAGNTGNGDVASKMTKGTLADGSIALLNEALPDCHRALGGFLSAGTPEGRNQFVVDPIETAGKMAVFYSYNPFPKVDVKNLRRIGQEILKVGESQMVLTRWKGKDGLEFDALFRRNAGTWRLDWNHFSHYSEYPWTLFLSGDPDEADFRLLARRKLSESDSERIGSRLLIKMFAPVFGKPLETGMESPDFLIDRQSDEGLLIAAALSAREEKKPPFGQTMAALQQPGDIRLHVRVKRSELGGRRTFTLDKVIACHWIDTDAVGYDLVELRDDLFGN